MNEFDYNDRDDEISQLFKDKAEKLEANPSFKAWDRLEHKLDSRRLRKRAVTYRYTSMVAAAIGLIALIMAVGLFEKMSSTGLDGQTASEAIEDDRTDDEKQIAEAIRLHRLENALEKEGIEIETYQENINKKEKTKQVVEIKEPKRVQPILDDVTDEESEPNNKVIDNKIGDRRKPLPEVPQDQPQKNPTKKVITKKQKTNAPVSPKPAVQKEILEEVEEEVAAEYDDAGNLDEDIRIEEPAVRLDKAPALNKDQEVTPSKNKRDAQDVTSTSAGKTNNYKVKEVSKAEKAKRKKSEKAINLAQFNWIKGRWKDALTANSYENWYEIEGAILGEGYVINGKDTTFTEYMKIYQKGKTVYFEGKIDDSQSMKKFKLKSFIGNKAIFERRGKNFPNQVVITKSSTAAFTIIYKNKKDKSIKESQAKYLNQRNYVEPTAPRRASRNLNRY